MTKQQQERLPHVPILYREKFRKIYAGDAHRAAMVKAKCLDCCCYQRLEVRACNATACPLWSIRPYQTDSEDTEQEPILGARPSVAGLPVNSDAPGVSK
jgi:hypothetical protein